MRTTAGSRLQLGRVRVLCVLCVVATLLNACATSNPLDAVAKPGSGADIGEVRAYGDSLLQVAHAEWPRSGFSAAIVSSDAILWSGSTGVMTGTGAAALPITPDLPMHV